MNQEMACDRGGTLESHQFAGIGPGVGGWTGTAAV